MNTQPKKPNDDAAEIAKQVGETVSDSKVITEPAETDVEVAAKEIEIAALQQDSRIGEFELKAIRRLRNETDSTLLKSLLNCYVSGGFESEALQSAIRLALSNGDPEELAVRHLRNITASPALKFLLTRYQNGDLEGEAVQAVLHLLASTHEPALAAINHLRSVSSDPFLKLLLAHYTSGDLQSERAQAALRLALPTQEPAQAAANYLRSVTSDSFMKLLLSHYANGDLQSERAQAALRLALPTQEPAQAAANYLRSITSDPFLKLLLAHYGNGDLQSERAQAALRLALPTTEPEVDAVNYLRRTTGDKSLKSLLSHYLKGGLRSETAQAALRLVLSDGDPEANAVALLRDTTESLFLKAILTHYLNGELTDPSLQAAMRRLIPKSQRERESDSVNTEDTATAASDVSKQGTAKRLLTERQFIAINSFPKSGNTWVRSFISHLCFDGSLTSVPDKYHENILDAPVHRLPDGRWVRFYKSHDKRLVYSFRDRGLSHAAVIHIRRHPLDVFLSYLNYMHLPSTDGQDAQSVRDNLYLRKFSGVDEIVKSGMLDAFFGIFLLYGTLNPKFIEAGSWYDNLRFWTSDQDDECPVFRLSYEDLLINQAQEFLAIGKFLGKSEKDVQQAFAATQAATAKDGRFFWKQRSGVYKELLSQEQIEKYRSLFGEELEHYGYSL